MKNQYEVSVFSETDKLKTVILHRPGEEIENLIPEYLDRLLFDDIPYLKVARAEHDHFASVLRENGTEVLYLEDLVAEAITREEVKEEFLHEVIREGYTGEMGNRLQMEGLLKEFLKSLPQREMVDKIMAGTRKKDVGANEEFDRDPFLLDPMPNLYFTRDPMAAIGTGISLNSMNTKTRKRETIFGKYIFLNHPEFKKYETPLLYNRDEHYSIEGGDELILSKDVVAIGHSQRSNVRGIKNIASNIFNGRDNFTTVLMFEIPKTRAFMHLDTVFTMVDIDKFTIHQGIETALKVTAISQDVKNNQLIFKEEVDSLQAVLVKYLKRDITLIQCGGGDRIISGREQWNDGSNSLAIAPGKVITYERNYVTNEVLCKNNVEVLTIPSSELSRGRGGPRCMSMPLCREGN